MEYSKTIELRKPLGILYASLLPGQARKFEDISDVEKVGAINIYRCRYIYCEMTMSILQWIIIFVLCMHSPDTCTPTAILVHIARDMR